MTGPPLTDLERELLTMCGDGSLGETTTWLLETMASPPDRATVEATLDGLVARGFMLSERGTYGGPLTDPQTGEKTHGVYDDDWWPVTDAGRAAIGMPPRAQSVRSRWINPSSGPWRVSPLIAPWCARRFRRGETPVPEWYWRLRGKRRAR
jgi:hypothetical protein